MAPTTFFAAGRHPVKIQLPPEIVYMITDHLAHKVVDLCRLASTCQCFKVAIDALLFHKCRAFRIGNQAKIFEAHRPAYYEIVKYHLPADFTPGKVPARFDEMVAERNNIYAYLLTLCEPECKRLATFPIIATLNFSKFWPRRNQELLALDQFNMPPEAVHSIEIALKHVKSVGRHRSNCMDKLKRGDIYTGVSLILALLPNLKYVNCIDDNYSSGTGGWDDGVCRALYSSKNPREVFGSLEGIYLNCSVDLASGVYFGPRSSLEDLNKMLRCQSLKSCDAMNVTPANLGKVPRGRFPKSSLARLNIRRSSVPTAYFTAILPHLSKLVWLEYEHDVRSGNSLVKFDAEAFGQAIGSLKGRLQTLTIEILEDSSVEFRSPRFGNLVSSIASMDLEEIGGVQGMLAQVTHSAISNCFPDLSADDLQQFLQDHADWDPKLLGSLAAFEQLQDLSVPWYILLSVEDTRSHDRLAELVPRSLKTLQIDHRAQNPLPGEQGLLVEPIAYLGGISGVGAADELSCPDMKEITLRGEEDFELHYPGWEHTRDACRMSSVKLELQRNVRKDGRVCDADGEVEMPFVALPLPY